MKNKKFSGSFSHTTPSVDWVLTDLRLAEVVGIHISPYTVGLSTLL